MSKCVFCKIAKGEIKPKTVYEDEDILGFEDLNPKAPIHILLIPRKHIARIADINKSNVALIGKLFVAANQVARKLKIESQGYRLVINCNKDAGQEVFHLHLHLLGGRKFTWPPG